MTTASSTSRTASASIRVTVQARAVNLDDDAQRASLAVADWLAPRDLSDLAAWRAEYAAAMNGETETNAETTRYGRLLASAEAVATTAATRGWARPEAFVTVDIEAA